LFILVTTEGYLTVATTSQSEGPSLIYQQPKYQQPCHIQYHRPTIQVLGTNVWQHNPIKFRTHERTSRKGEPTALDHCAHTVYFEPGRESARAKPKSHSLSTPFFDINKFSGLISR
jgi:hypothetical protein